mmetsp:Transcript_16111/g.48543  ORF Transcript_16111/g.48543 Transcript_16111/m.48543 type:complete len:181 (+) Transcript_16111:3-545(+)
MVRAFPGVGAANGMVRGALGHAGASASFVMWFPRKEPYHTAMECAMHCLQTHGQLPSRCRGYCAERAKKTWLILESKPKLPPPKPWPPDPSKPAWVYPHAPGEPPIDLGATKTREERFPPMPRCLSRSCRYGIHAGPTLMSGSEPAEIARSASSAWEAALLPAPVMLSCRRRKADWRGFL